MEGAKESTRGGELFPNRLERIKISFKDFNLQFGFVV